MPFGRYKKSFMRRSRKGLYGGFRRRVKRRLPQAGRTLVRTARNVAASRQVKQSVCRSLGTAYPSCLVTNFRIHGLYPLSAAATFLLQNGSGIAADKFYNIPMELLPGLCSNAFGSVAGASSNVQFPPGMTRLYGPSGTGLYELGCVLRIQMILKINLWVNQNAVAGGALNTGLGTKWQHFLHLRDNSQDALPNPSTQALADQAYVQPDVQRKVKGQVRTSMSISNGAANAGTSVTFYSQPAHTIIWKRTILPYLVLDQPFQVYLGNDASWSTYNNTPSNHARLDIAGFGNSYNSLQIPENAGSIEIDFVFKMALKDPYSNIP